MAFALIAHAGTSSSGTATTPGIDTTGANLLVVHAAYFSGSAAVSDSKGNTWTALTAQGTGSRTSQLFYCIPTGVGAGHTFSHNGAFGSTCVAAFSGADTTTPFDAESGSVGAFQPGSITPAGADELLVCGLQHSDATSESIDGGFAITDDEPDAAGVGCTLAYLIETTLATKNPTWSPGSNARTTMAAFRAAAGGGGGGPTTNPAALLMCL